MIDDEEWVARQIEHGQPEFIARFMRTIVQASRAGYFAGVDLLLGELLGRQPRRNDEYLGAGGFSDGFDAAGQEHADV